MDIKIIWHKVVIYQQSAIFTKYDLMVVLNCETTPCLVLELVSNITSNNKLGVVSDKNIMYPAVKGMKEDLLTRKWKTPLQNDKKG